MTGILNGSIAACRRTTYCLRFLRLPCRPLNHCQALATQHHRRRTHSSSCGSGDQSGKDHQNQLKSIPVGQKEQPSKGSGGLEVTAAPPNPKDVPGEKTKESPSEVRPGLPLEAQPSRTPVPLEVKPHDPHTIICSSDSKASTPAPPIDDAKYQAPSSKNTELQSKESTFLSIESELNSLKAIVNEFIEDPRNPDLSSIKSELTSQGSSKTEVTQGQAESKNEQKSQASHLTKAETKSQDWLHTEGKEESKPQKCQDASQNPQVNQLTSSSSTQSHSGNVDSAQSPRPQAVLPYICGFRFPEEGTITVPEGKMSETADTFKENVVDNEIIDQWVDKFKQFYMAEKASFGLDNENEVSASTDKKNLMSLVKKNNVWVLNDSKTAETIPPPSEPGLSKSLTNKSSPGPTLPLKIVAKPEAPTKFKTSMKRLDPSKLESDKYVHLESAKASTKPLEFILEQLPKADLKGITEEIVAMLDSDPDPKVTAGKTPKSGEILMSGQEKFPGPATEQIVAMFKDDFNADLVRSEEARAKEFEAFDGLSRTQNLVLESTKSSQANVPVMSASGSEKTGDASSNEVGKMYQSDSKLSKLGESIMAKEDAKVPEKKDNSDKVSTIQGGNLEEVLKKKDEVKSKLTDKDAVVSKESEKDKSFDQTSFDLAEKISSFIKSANESDAIGKQPLQREKSSTNEPTENDQKGKPNPETTSMLPGDLYDPDSSEVSSATHTPRFETNENDELSSGLEAPEVRAGTRKEEPKVPATQAKDENKSKVDEKTSNAEKASNEEKAPVAEKLERREKPKLNEGELSMKLLDKASEGMPASGAEIPGSASASQSPAEKSLMQKLFDKILGRSGKGEGKRQMSTYSVQRQMSTSCTFSVQPGLVSDSRSELYEEKRDNDAPDYVRELFMQPSTLELFAKDTKDLTEIRGGSPACSEPKKSPRDLLREKQNSRHIKILGGSEECAKKMKRIKELTKDTDDDCDRDHFSGSLSHFLRQLRVSLRGHFIGVTELN